YKCGTTHNQTSCLAFLGRLALALLASSLFPHANAAVTLSPTSLSFGNQLVGTTSAARTVTLNNGANSVLSITSIATSGDFSQTNNCGSSLPKQSSCTISVTFRPTAGGSRTGTLTVTDSANNSPQTASLSGTGTTAPAVSLSPTSLSFGNQL